MKKQQLKELIATLAVAAFILLVPACATQTTQTSDVADTDMERALITAGFKVRPATAVEQRNGIAGLPGNRFTVMNEAGKLYYLYPDRRDNRLYVGDHWAYQAFVGQMKNNKLRKEGAFVWEVDPGDKPNNKTIEVWYGYPPFRDW